MRVIAGIAALVVLSAGAVVLVLIRSPMPFDAWLTNPAASFMLAQGEYPRPIQLVRPAAAPLSALAQLGKKVFFDPSLSGSGRVSCASCHNPQDAYGPSGTQPAAYGGNDLTSQGVRAVPSLMYLNDQPNFSVGPDNNQNETVTLAQLAARGSRTARATKTAQDTTNAAANMVPQGGLFWDGRADTLQGQAFVPLFNPIEMNGGNVQRVVAKLQAAPYADRFTTLFGPQIFSSPGLAVAEAMSAVARYEIEDPSFHPYTSKFDYWLEGKVRLNPAELRGYILFNDPHKGDCAACHVDQPTRDGSPPLFTDRQYEALGVPRNPQLAANRDPDYFDLGICGPYRTDMVSETQYCGMFLTPTLRNVATRHVFFHNGVDHTLKGVLDFYDFRDTEPQKVYPRDPGGQVEKFNDLPKRYWANIDTVDPPLNRHLGKKPALSTAEENDMIAFLKTLTDSYRSPPAGRS